MFNFKRLENSILPPYFCVGKQRLNGTVLVMCGKQKCSGVKNKNVQVWKTKNRSFSLFKVMSFSVEVDSVENKKDHVQKTKNPSFSLLNVMSIAVEVGWLQYKTLYS